MKSLKRVLRNEEKESVAIELFVYHKIISLEFSRGKLSKLNHK